MLGLNLSEARISEGLVTTAESLPGFEILSVLGIVEGVFEDSFSAVGIGGIGFEKGGEMDRLLNAAKEKLSLAAASIGANAIIGFRYEIMGRHVEKSALAYGTAVKCRRLEK
jgi:uncharacterized protein YbjQ (UPF0145 family)